ncbi:hypothetical protein D3C73_939100 [compost metagenome]
MRSHTMRKETAAPHTSPPIAIHRKLSAASVMENAPVTIAATANLKATNPEASFMRDSPSRSRIIPLGK